MTTTLEHPLPPGMRDLLPAEAKRRRDLSRAVIERMSLHGYQLVTPPAFELASVLERGLGANAADDVVRFIEPESGEVAVLRPDMTPQIARMIATRMSDRQPPFRLAYEGTVIRRRSSRAKKHRQIPQVGVELCGVEGLEGDLELVQLVADVLRSVGLSQFVIDLSDAAIVRELFAGVPPTHAERLSNALARKDELALRELMATPPVAPQFPTSRDVERVIVLSRLHGDRSAIASAVTLLHGTRAEQAASRLLALFDAACAAGLGPHLAADPGEVRGFAYYTGAIFSIFAEGASDVTSSHRSSRVIGAGGRYDDLLARYGAPRAAVGFALDLDALEQTLHPAVRSSRSVVLVGNTGDPRLAELRAHRVAATTASSAEEARAYARDWGFSLVVEDGRMPADAIVRMLDAAGSEP